jgi:hypothetical protein
MYHTIYETINTTNGKKYIGKHSTDNIDDLYLGSGILIKQAISKYGRDVFTKNILFVFDNEEDMNIKERELVTESVVNNMMYYNLAPGGEGGDVIKFDEHKRAMKSQKLSDKLKGRKKSQSHKDNISKYHADVSGKNNPNYGKKHSEATLEKIRNRAQNRSPIQCIHCKKITSPPNHYRWHGLSCKLLTKDKLGIRT